MQRKGEYMKIQYLGFIPLLLLEIWIWLPPYKSNSTFSPILGYVPDENWIMKTALRTLSFFYILVGGLFWAIGY